MNYVEKDYEEIFEAALQDSLENGLISHAENFEDFIANKQDISNYYVMDKSVISQMIAKIYSEGITPSYESAKVEYAEGTDLEDIGEIVGISRPEATNAYADVTFSIDTVLEEDILIADEIIISTENGIEYHTLEPVYIPAGGTECTISCISAETGIGSRVGENSLVNIETDLEVPLDCINHNPSTGGNEEYTDDEYRYLLMNWKNINLKGSNEAFEEYFANFDGIDSYKLVPLWDGSGTVKCILDPGTPYQLNKAYDELQSMVTQMTEDIVMAAPIRKLIDIYAVVNVDIDQLNPYSDTEKEDIKSRIVQGIKVFIDGGYTTNGDYYTGLVLGEDFIPHKLAVFLDEEIPELKNITFNYPDDYISILDEEIGTSNSIIIEMV